MSLLKVLPVKMTPPKLDDLNPILPPHAFNMGIVAPPRAGKSNLIMNLLLNPDFYYNKKKAPFSYFDEIYYVSPTSPFDFTTKNMLPKLDNIIIVSDPDEIASFDVILEQLQREQSEADEEERKKILIVYDDCVGILEKSKKLQQLSTKFRHYSMSIITVSQSYRRIPLTMRNCWTALIVFDLKNEKEFGKIHDEFTGSIPNSEALIKQIVKKRFDFFYFNIERQQMYHNFEKLMWSRDDNEMVIKKEMSPSPSPPLKRKTKI